MFDSLLGKYAASIYTNKTPGFQSLSVEVCLYNCIFGGRRLDAGPLYINELDTINSLLHHKKHVRGSSDIGFVAFNIA